MRVFTFQMTSEMPFRGSVSVTIRVKKAIAVWQSTELWEEPYGFCMTLTMILPSPFSPALDVRLSFPASVCPFPTLSGKSRRRHFPWDSPEF